MINFYIKTYGCQANAADSQAVSNFLIDLGCKEQTSELDAELIIVNTCAIRDKAEHKVYSYIGSLIKLKRKQHNFKVVVIGCIATYRKKEFYSRFPSVIFVSGARDKKEYLQKNLIDLVLSLETTNQLFDKPKISNVSTKTKVTRLKKFDLKLGGIKNDIKHAKQSFVNIMTGCNNFCTYCIVPFTRGREISYSAFEIIEKIKFDIAQGVKEVTLIGQNVNSYKDPENGLNFAQLLEKIAKLDGEFWIRFVSPHPKDMSLDVIKIMVKYPEKICNWIHHPVQSGSNEILEAMKRSYTVEKYLEQIDWIRKYLPDATISTDIIVGFPGETEVDYLKTRELMETVRFDNIFSFIYSPRKFTKAALLEDNCLYKEKQRRLNELQKRSIQIVKEKNEKYVGKKLRCLVEKRTTNGKLLARSSGNHRILFDGDDLKIDTFVKIKVESAGAVNFTGALDVPTGSLKKN